MTVLQSLTRDVGVLRAIEVGAEGVAGKDVQY